MRSSPEVSDCGWSRAKSAARCLALAVLTALAFSRSVQVPARPRNPPRTVARSSRQPKPPGCGQKSSCIHALRPPREYGWSIGLQPENRRPQIPHRSIRLDTKATLRAKRSSLAMTNVDLCTRHSARAAASCGRSLRRPLSISTNSPITSRPAVLKNNSATDEALARMLLSLVKERERNPSRLATRAVLKIIERG